MAKMKDDSIRFRIKGKDKEKLQILANQEGSTMSEFIRSLILQKCKRIKINNSIPFTCRGAK